MINHIFTLKVPFFLFCITLISRLVQAQGCSDAGFCTMGALKPDQKFTAKNVKLRSLEIAEGIGTTSRNGQYVSVTSVELGIGIGDKNTLQIKVPFKINRGSWSTQGISDISLSFSRRIYKNSKYQISAVVGAKIPVGEPTLTSGGNQLPMFYQNTLGTYDIIAGISLNTKHWLFATGIQHPLNQINNTFKWGAWAGTDQENTINYYQLSNQLKRGTDAMLRVEYNFRLARWNFLAGLLNIYRINKDEITSPQTGQRIEIANSDGLVVNLIGGIGYRFSAKTSVNFILGANLDKLVPELGLARIENGDGLYRKLVFNFSYQFNF